MEQSASRVALVIVAIIASLCVELTSLAQSPNELDSAARARIEQARASIVIIKAENESARPVAQAAGFFVRNDLVATDTNVLGAGSRVSLTAKSKEGHFKVLSHGDYFIPYVLL